MVKGDALGWECVAYICTKKKNGKKLLKKLNRKMEVVDPKCHIEVEL